MQIASVTVILSSGFDPSELVCSGLTALQSAAHRLCAAQVWPSRAAAASCVRMELAVNACACQLFRIARQTKRVRINQLICASPLFSAFGAPIGPQRKECARVGATLFA